VLLAIAAAAIASLIVPRLPAGDPAATAHAAGRMTVRATLIGIASGGAVALLAPLIVAVIGPGLEQGVSEQAVDVLRIYSLSIPGTAAAFVYASYGYAAGRVWASGLSTTAYALTWLALLFVPGLSDDVESVALAGVFATAVQVLAAFLISSAGLPRPRPVFTDLRISRGGMAAIGAVLGAAVVARAGLVLDPLFGSLLPVGSVSELSYAARIAALAILLCGQGVAFSLLTSGRERGERAPVDARVGLVAAAMLSASAAIVILIAGPTLTELILARGELTVPEAHRIGELLQLWAPGVIAFTLVWALEALLYAELRTAEVLTRALAGLAVNVAASALLVLALGIEGRPLGVLAGVLAQLALLAVLFRSDARLAALRRTETWRLLVANALAVAATVGLVYGLSNLAGFAEAGAVAATLGAAAISLALLHAYSKRGEGAGVREPEGRVA
jgi:putative peptidoglycan lipid II flippase